MNQSLMGIKQGLCLLFYDQKLEIEQDYINFGVNLIIVRKRGRLHVEFYIANGELYKIKKEGKDKKVLRYMRKKAPEWLNNPCAALPAITNQQNANLQWIQLHPPKQ